jgi:hypothetical protein
MIAVVYLAYLPIMDLHDRCSSYMITFVLLPSLYPIITTTVLRLVEQLFLYFKEQHARIERSITRSLCFFLALIVSLYSYSVQICIKFETVLLKKA